MTNYITLRAFDSIFGPYIFIQKGLICQIEGVAVEQYLNYHVGELLSYKEAQAVDLHTLKGGSFNPYCFCIKLFCYVSITRLYEFI